MIMQNTPIAIAILDVYMQQVLSGYTSIDSIWYSDGLV